MSDTIRDNNNTYRMIEKRTCDSQPPFNGHQENHATGAQVEEHQDESEFTRPPLGEHVRLGQ